MDELFRAIRTALAFRFYGAASKNWSALDLGASVPLWMACPRHPEMEAVGMVLIPSLN